MSKDEKKASVSDLLRFIQEVIETGIDSELDAALTPLELIYITVNIYYQRALREFYQREAQRNVETICATINPSLTNADGPLAPVIQFPRIEK